MQVGTLVRVIRSKDLRSIVKYGKLGVVMNNGTWSADVYIIGSNSSYYPRIAKEDLEVLACK